MSIFRRRLLQQALAVPKPIGQWEIYDLTNEGMAQNPVITDLTGNGHDITCHNFAWTEESGINTTLHKGALVSDGVDDYGICENFPILTKEKGYTVVALRKPINIDSGVYVSKRGNNNGTIIGAFAFEKFQASSPDYPKTCYSFGSVNKIDSYPNLFSYMTSKSYNGKSLTAGNINDDSYLIVFAGFITITDTDYTVGEQGSCALYALEIYDRDLTDAEIAKVKARMIKQYESKTGLKYEEA